MFDIGWTELFIIAVVAIIVVGPKDLPRMLRTLGRYAAQVRRMAGEFRTQFDEAIRETELDELRSTLREASDLNPVNQIRDSVNESLAPLKEPAKAEEIKDGAENSEPAETPDSQEPEAKSDGAGKAKESEAEADAAASKG